MIIYDALYAWCQSCQGIHTAQNILWACKHTKKIIMQTVTQSQLSAATLPPFMPHYSKAATLAELSNIYQPHINLCWYPRNFSPALMQFIESYTRAKPAPLEIRLDPKAPTLEQHFQHLPASPGRDEFIADLDFICQLYGDLVEPQQIGFRLTYLESTMCPKFHVDRVGIRLLCTYYGQSTEWLENHNVDRTWLGNRADSLLEMERRLMRDPSTIRSLPTGSIGLLKGESGEDNAGNGIVHRSPAPSSGECRLLLTLDFIN
jgi:hypothetical protein